MRKTVSTLVVTIVAAAAMLASGRSADAHWTYGGWGNNDWKYHHWGWGYRPYVYGGWRYGGLRFGGFAAGPVIERTIVAVPHYVYYPTAYYHYRLDGYYPYNYAPYIDYYSYHLQYWRACGSC
jgi:hypothetical protein